jgi:hypothetical protein
MSRPREPKKFPKKAKISRLVQQANDLQHLGPEPVPVETSEITDLALSKMYYWYNYSCTAKDAREYITTWLKARNRWDEAKAFNKVSDGRLPTTVAWLCRIESRGAILAERSVVFREDRIAAALKHIGEATEPVEGEEAPQERGVDIQGRVRERGRDIIGMIESEIDKDPSGFVMYDHLTKNEVKPTYATGIAAYYEKQALEFDEALKGKDAQLKEGYSYLTKTQLKEMAAKYHQYAEEAVRFGQNQKKTRIVERKPRTVSADKVVKDFKYKKNDTTLQIASVSPESIIGAAELWVYSTKYKVVTVYRAIDRGGLQIKYTSIANFDPATSKAGSCGRKPPQDFIKKVLEGGKVTLRSFHDNMKSGYFKPRITPDDILLGPSNDLRWLCFTLGQWPVRIAMAIVRSVTFLIHQ